MKKLILSFLTLLPVGLMAQNSGSITYEEKIQLKIDFGDNVPMSEDLKSMIPSSKSTEKILLFNPKHSLYKNIDNKSGDENISQLTSESSIEVVLKRPENVTYQDLAANKVVEKQEFMDRIFLISDESEKQAWKITGEQKEILGYVCQQATTVRDSSKIEAWFTPQIAVSSGPGKYGGLPGLILETNKNDGEAVVTAKHIDLQTDINDQIVPPTKGKKVNRKQFNKIREEKMKEMELQYGGSGKGTRVFIQRN
ncbi:MAG: GLPGLI family protein [Bacteroidota bacterium]